MFEEKWSTFNTELRNIEAAKKGVTVPCPHPMLGTVGTDHVSIEIPTYQRGLVWTPKHGEQFQQALQRGWPIGQLVLAETTPTALPGGTGLLRQYKLIDGQQRTFWLNRTADNFFSEHEYSLEEAATSTAIQQIALGLGTDHGKVTESIHKWTATQSFKTSHLRDIQFMLHHLTADLSVLPPKIGDPSYDTCSEGILGVNDALAAQYAALQDLTIPVLLIRQELQEDLHEIFQKLNEGTRLSDLDLMAAEWQLSKANVLDSTLDQGIKDRLIDLAQSRISSTYDQDAYEYDPDLVELNAAELSVFDFLYALGRYAAQKYPKTFEGLGSASDRLAIFVAALIFAGGISKRKDLISSYPDASAAAGRDVDSFSNFFLLACGDLDGAFSKLNAVDAGKRLRGRLGLVQAAAYLASHIVSVGLVDRGAGPRLLLTTRQSNNEKRLERDPTVVASPTQRRERFKQHVVGWFLADTLGERFQGSDAYAQASARVWTAFAPSQGSLLINEDMLGPVNPDIIATELARRFLREADIQATPARRRYSEPGCALLRTAYAYSSEVISAEELDHVLPFDTKNGAQFPVAINHTANLMPMKKTINTARKERWVPVYFADPSVSADTKSAVRARLLVPDTEAGASALASGAAYMAFLKLRWRQLSSLALLGASTPGIKSQKDALDFYDLKVAPLLVESD